MSRPVACLRHAARLLLGEYGLWHIRAKDLAGYPPPRPGAFRLGRITSDAELAGAFSPDLWHYSVERTPGRLAFGAWVDDDLASLAFFMTNEGFKDEGPIWAMRDDEAEIAQLATRPEYRGRGIAPALLDYGCHEMSRRGFSRLIAKIWIGNRASMRAFDKAGWAYVAFMVVLHPFQSKRPLRIVRKRR